MRDGLLHSNDERGELKMDLRASKVLSEQLLSGRSWWATAD